MLCLNSCKNELPESDMYQSVDMSLSMFQCVCKFVHLATNGKCCQGSHRKNSHESFRRVLYQKRLRLKQSDKWCHNEARLVMERFKTFKNNNTGIHSWLWVNLGVWPNDDAVLSTGSDERNWVWNSRPRSISAPVWKQKEHSTIREGGVLVLRPHA